MTTDAKIGLLLGLVFIVIIAFVINGLPSFNKSDNSTDLTNKYVTTVGNAPMGPPTNQNLDTTSSEVNTASPITAAEKNPITQVNKSIETPLPTQETVMTVGNPKAAEEPLVASETTLAPIEPAVTPTSAEAATVSAAPAEQKSTVYVVKKGDNLGLIAQNCYGTQGPKKENVTKIVKANHLKSEKQIYIGQKLVIPTPTALASSTPSMFEKVQTISKSLTGSPAAKETPAVEKGVRDYVVKSGDYPWKIAKKELGDGNRYKEVFKYNPNINEKTKLSVGMHLKLPQK